MIRYIIGNSTAYDDTFITIKPRKIIRQQRIYILCFNIFQTSLYHLVIIKSQFGKTTARHILCYHTTTCIDNIVNNAIQYIPMMMSNQMGHYIHFKTNFIRVKHINMRLAMLIHYISVIECYRRNGKAFK